MYWHGDWQDLCRGPHLQHTGQLPADAFKLMSVAGAYWRGDSKRAMLQRIYGVAFTNKEKLKAHLHMLEEAAKRDHRKLGREMDLYHMQEEAPGQVFWHPNGWTIYTELQDYMRRKQRAGGYVEVNTPQVVDRKLWVASGHWDKYQESMFIVEVDEEHAREKAVNALKADELPLPRADFQPRPQILPGFAPAHGRIRQLRPVRALRRSARYHAGAGLHPR